MAKAKVHWGEMEGPLTVKSCLFDVWDIDVDTCNKRTYMYVKIYAKLMERSEWEEKWSHEAQNA